MDGFVGDVEQEMKCTAGEPRCQPCSSPQATAKTCVDVMGYHDAREIPNYWTYAQNFGLQDHMYEPVASMSLPSHVSLVSGWSAKCPAGDANPLDCVNALSPGSRAADVDGCHLPAPQGAGQLALLTSPKAPSPTARTMKR